MRCRQLAGAAAGCSGGNAGPAGRPGWASAMALMATTATAAVTAASISLPRRRVGIVMGLTYPSARARSRGRVPRPELGIAAGRRGARRRLDVAVAIAGAPVVVGVLVSAVALRDGIG